MIEDPALPDEPFDRMIEGVSRRTSSRVFVGRQPELDRLDDAYARAVVGRPSLILVAGEAGIGKTRLISEFEGAIERAGGIAISGGCLDLGEGGLPYAPFVEALRAHRRGSLDPEPKASACASSAARRSP